MYQPQPDRLQTFWRTFQEVWLKLYGSRLATIAAINVSTHTLSLLMIALCLQSLHTVFSAGLDFAELRQPNPDRFMAFYKFVQEVYLKLCGSRLATVAAINVSKCTSF